MANQSVDPMEGNASMPDVIAPLTATLTATSSQGSTGRRVSFLPMDAHDHPLMWGSEGNPLPETQMFISHVKWPPVKVFISYAASREEQQYDPSEAPPRDLEDVSPSSSASNAPQAGAAVYPLARQFSSGAFVKVGDGSAQRKQSISLDQWESPSVPEMVGALEGKHL